MPSGLVVVAGSVALVALAVIVAMFVTMRRPAQVRVEVSGGVLTVEPLGLDKIWCVRRRVVVPLSAVTGARAAQREDIILPNLRLPGTYFPGVIAAGSYGVGRHRAFWDVRRERRLLVIDCVPGNPSGYRQLVLEMPDPDATAAALKRALGAIR